MTPAARSGSLTRWARLGFARASEAETGARELEDAVARPREEWAEEAVVAADADAALAALRDVSRRDPEPVRRVLSDPRARRAAWALLGASSGFAEFYVRNPEELLDLLVVREALPVLDGMRRELSEAIGAEGGVAAVGGEDGRCALRVAYRRVLARIAVHDLLSVDPVAEVDAVAESLSDLAGAALDGALALARAAVSAAGPAGRALFPAEEVAATRLAVIGMGKAGARELNYVSDVDVIFVAESADTADVSLPEGRMLDIATRLASLTMQGLSEVEREPALWEVDANLRPEGARGVLVRTLDSHLSYYERWAKSWEFQALLKARALAGDPVLGGRYVDAVRPAVWSSAAREDFVESVQRMRERVTEHIPAEHLPRQLKLGPGGIRDIEFTVQLLQLVHGLTDEDIRQRATLPALDALVAAGYIGRDDAAAFAHDYRVLRLIEHRLQLVALARTHLIPEDPAALRLLARSSRLAADATAMRAVWDDTAREVRDIHVRLFYRPLLSAVASLPEEQRTLSAEQAHDRLSAIGFRDAAGALRTITALTTGIRRKATIQRHLMPVMLQWFAEGVDPDEGLLAFRRISERLGDSPWFLRMLRDSSGAAENLTRVLSGSRYIGALMEGIPESAAWLDREERLQPRGRTALEAETEAILERHAGRDEAMRAVRAVRRRELLRTAMGGVLGVLGIEEIAVALSDIADTTIAAGLRAVRRDLVPEDARSLQLAVIGMGRLGGAELGFGSDADVLFVFDPAGTDPGLAERTAMRVATELRSVLEDTGVPFELDADLRPEGRNGPLVRSMEAYAQYYRRWSVSWEAQALLRARPIAGDVELCEAFVAVADEVRYPVTFEERDAREIKRIKARVESERLPQGADRSRHVKLGPGGLSDVEWLVQLLQLRHAQEIPALRTTSTLGALGAATEAGLLAEDDASLLREAWLLASRLRSAHTLLSGQTSDVLPVDRRRLDGIGRLLGYPPRSAARVEEDFLSTARRARRVFDRLFYG